MTTTTVAARTRRTRSPFAAAERLLQRRRVGPVDRAPIGAILALLPQLPDWPAATAHRTMRLRGATTILDWLLTHPGEGWQDRWTVSDADRDASWIGTLAPDDTRLAVTKRQEHVAGLACLLMCRVVLPSYDFLAAYRAKGLLDRARNIMRPEMFARLENAAAERGLSGRDRSDALSVITKIVLHTGTDVDALTAGDVLEVYAWSVHSQRRQVPGLHVAWDLLGDIGVIPAGLSLRAALRRGQRSTAELVGEYDICCRPIRDVFIRYLDERRPALDYNSLISLAGELAGTFWADIERHHPGIDTLHLPDEIAQAWKERVRVVTATDGTVRPRKNIHALLMRVRAFYLDIQQWALEDPSWVPWAVPSPVRKADTLGYEKARRKTVAAMHQRVRERLPHLPALADAAERCRAETAALLAAATEREPGEVFDHAGTRYRRRAPKSADLAARHRGSPAVTVKNLVTGEAINLTRREDEAFWAWAIIETLRLSGVRLEELLEITHLALVSYQLPGTGEIVPLLQIVPSKSNEERLLLVDPELASVLATIITRLRARNGGTVPLVARYDHHERVTGPLLPHLFQRARGARREVISPGTVYKLINTALAAAGLKDATGQPLVYRPHDFRRCFTTDAVTGGLPVHIAARLLGHKRLTTTETYMAVFQEDLIRSYRAFLDTRRATRPAGEYREPTDQEWQEFQRHFQMRKVALGTCGRPYGSSCQHEHACLRCAMLRISPQQRPRLTEIIHNLHERITEARMNGWLGEVQGLQVSLEAAKRKLASLDRSIERNRRTGPADLGMPIIRDPNDRRDPAPPNPQKYTVNGQKLIRKMAYGNIYSNQGAMTPGASGETADGMSEDKIDQITGLMRHERYRFSPARRIYIPKKNGKLRPLGLPSWSDKLVGEVVRLLLEAIYEPRFSDRSHGFRKGRGCHTALRDIRETWTGTVWFIEGDVSDCFGSFDHETLLRILAEKIHDNRFLRLIRNMLKAGYLEDWEYHDTLSGVPQGGVVSPILSNIYLDKLDEFVEQELIPQYTRGTRRKSNPEYHEAYPKLSLKKYSPTAAL